MEPMELQTAPVSEMATSEVVSHSNAVSTPIAPLREERRRKPRTWETPPAPVPAPHLDDYKSIVGLPVIDELRFLANGLKGKTLKMVNSTAVGGGVAEMLNQLVPLLNELDLRTKWDVITGGNDFFEVTKAFHNALQGSDYKLTPQARDIFLIHNEQNRKRMEFSEDVVVIHDPQPAALVRGREDSSRRWIWRCHIDLSNPNPDVWGFLRPFIEQYDAAIFSSQSFTRQLAIPQYLFYPCIDPLSEKNKDLDDSFVQQVCDEFGVDRSRPIVTQVSRFDRAKDPVGVVAAFKQARKYVDCQLVLAGGGATDDPECDRSQRGQGVCGRRPGHNYSRLAALVRARNQRVAAGLNDHRPEIDQRRVWTHGNRSVVEGEANYRRSGGRNSQPDYPQTYGSVGPLGGRLCVSNAISVDPSAIRQRAGREWA